MSFLGNGMSPLGQGSLLLEAVAFLVFILFIVSSCTGAPVPTSTDLILPTLFIPSLDPPTPTVIPIVHLAKTAAIELPTPISPPTTALLLPSSSPTALNIGFRCPGTILSRLHVGVSARVTITDGRPLRVRRNPEFKEGDVLGQLSEGVPFQIIGGPECVEDPETNQLYLFWEIRMSNGRTGWAAEGEPGSYFIEPWP